jgi:lactate dehydrogenase-like 2-hydroxyacid dehydrogenase
MSKEQESSTNSVAEPVFLMTLQCLAQFGDLEKEAIKNLLSTQNSYTEAIRLLSFFPRFSNLG